MNIIHSDTILDAISISNEYILDEFEGMNKLTPVTYKNTDTILKTAVDKTDNVKASNSSVNNVIVNTSYDTTAKDDMIIDTLGNMNDTIFIASTNVGMYIPSNINTVIDTINDPTKNLIHHNDPIVDAISISNEYIPPRKSERINKLTPVNYKNTYTSNSNYKKHQMKTFSNIDVDKFDEPEKQINDDVQYIKTVRLTENQMIEINKNLDMVKSFEETARQAALFISSNHFTEEEIFSFLKIKLREELNLSHNCASTDLTLNTNISKECFVLSPVIDNLKRKRIHHVTISQQNEDTNKTLKTNAASSDIHVVVSTNSIKSLSSDCKSLKDAWQSTHTNFDNPKQIVGRETE
jgi:hypothetical protein